MYRIGVIGDRDSVLGFQALGLEVCPVENAEEARQALHRMAKENFAILYLTEQLSAQLQRSKRRALLWRAIACRKAIRRRWISLARACAVRGRPALPSVRS